MKKRILSLFLAVVLSFSCCSGIALADDDITFAEISGEGEYTAEIEDEEGGYVYYSFTPDETAFYSLSAAGDGNPEVYVYDTSWNVLSSNEGEGECSTAVELTAGTEYYLAFYLDFPGTLDITVAIADVETEGSCGEDVQWSY